MAVSRKDICSRGYLPAEMPPCFTSTSFAKYISAKTVTSGLPPYTEGVNFNLARAGGLRRRLTIPNPEAFDSLVTVLVRDWSLLDAKFRQDPLKSSAPNPKSKTTDRALTPSLWFPERTRERARLRSNARFVLFGDLSQCYSSIYTHSVSWALAGKSVAKKALHASSRAPVDGDDIDKRSQRIQSGQTKGIPAGPDTSLAIAELILTSIDIELANRMPSRLHRNRLPALRISDDFEYYATSRSEAEDALLGWETAAAVYELQINPSKTEILELPQILHDSWVTQLDQFRFRQQSVALFTNDLYSFFSTVHALASDNRTASIIKYAVRFTSGLLKVYGSQDTWDAFSDLLLMSMISEPSCLNAACDAFERALQHGLKIDRDQIAETLNEIVDRHAQLEHGAEVCWALYMIATLQLRVTTDAAKKVVEMEDTASTLMLKGLIEKSRVSYGSSIDVTKLEARAVTTEVTHSSDWLLAYEFAAHGWCDDKVVKADHWMRDMLFAGVQFFECPNPFATDALSKSVSEVKEDPEADLSVDVGDLEIISSRSSLFPR